MAMREVAQKKLLPELREAARDGSLRIRDPITLGPIDFGKDGQDPIDALFQKLINPPLEVCVALTQDFIDFAAKRGLTIHGELPANNGNMGRVELVTATPAQSEEKSSSETSDDETLASHMVDRKNDIVSGSFKLPNTDSGFSKSRKKRRDLLTPLIEAAQRDCEDPYDAPAVWTALVNFAEQGKKPFLGVTDDGLKWQDANDATVFFTLKNLRDRLGRELRELGKAR